MTISFPFALTKLSSQEQDPYDSIMHTMNLWACRHVAKTAIDSDDQVALKQDHYYCTIDTMHLNEHVTISFPQSWKRLSTQSPHRALDDESERKKEPILVQYRRADLVETTIGKADQLIFGLTKANDNREENRLEEASLLLPHVTLTNSVKMIPWLW